MQPNDELSVSGVIQNVVYRQDCFIVSIDLFNFLKNLGADAFIAWKDEIFKPDGTSRGYGHVWVVMNIFGMMIPLETQLFGVPNPLFDYSNPDVLTNDLGIITEEYDRCCAISP